MLRKLFLEKEIISREGVIHFRRWRLLSLPWFSIYIHQIFKEDQDKYLHDHPWDYFNLILKGSYTEEYSFSMKHYTRKLNFLNYSFNDSYRFHKIHSLNSKLVTTLFITGRRKREWGYKIGEYWIHNDFYRKNKDIESKLKDIEFTDGIIIKTLFHEKFKDFKLTKKRT